MWRLAALQGTQFLAVAEVGQVARKLRRRPIPAGILVGNLARRSSMPPRSYEREVGRDWGLREVAAVVVLRLRRLQVQVAPEDFPAVAGAAAARL
jgi:hypothetical protein